MEKRYDLYFHYFVNFELLWSYYKYIMEKSRKKNMSNDENRKKWYINKRR